MAGLHSPGEALVTAPLLVRALVSRAVEHDTEILTGTTVAAIEVSDGAVTAVETTAGSIRTPAVVNAAGLDAARNRGARRRRHSHLSEPRPAARRLRAARPDPRGRLQPRPGAPHPRRLHRRRPARAIDRRERDHAVGGEPACRPGDSHGSRPERGPDHGHASGNPPGAGGRHADLRPRAGPTRLLPRQSPFRPDARRSHGTRAHELRAGGAARGRRERLRARAVPCSASAVRPRRPGPSRS